MAEIYKEHHKELGSIYVPKTIARILIDVSMIGDFSRKVMILEFHIQSLEEEMRRIGTSKRPLHYSMHFLEDAIEILKQEILKWKRSFENSPVVEELMPLKSGFGGCLGAKELKDINEKREWMSSVQLWTTSVQYDNNFDTKNEDSLLHDKSSYEGYQASSSGGNFNHKAAGTFMPFKCATMKNKGVDPISSSSAAESEATPIDLNVKRMDPQLQKPCPQPLQKKQRRCWSPELHKQFVDALHQLGGAESTTPKQIREVMNVKGLTNNEVKSHLQKYRHHIRKLPFSGHELSYSWPISDKQCGGASTKPCNMTFFRQ